MREIDPDAVRGIMGDWAKNLSDDQLMSEDMARLIEAEIASTCPTWNDIVDSDDIARLDTAISYLASARLASNIGGIKSMTLGDQAMTLNTGFIANEQARWRRDALALISSVCPVPVATVTRIGVHFGKASGRRG